MAGDRRGASDYCNNIGGGNETKILDILNALLMIVQGEPSDDPYGPVSIGALDKRALKNFYRYAKNRSSLVKNYILDLLKD